MLQMKEQDKLRKKTQRNGDKQFNWYRVKRNDYKDSHQTWERMEELSEKYNKYLENIEKNQSEMKKAISDIKIHWME